MPHNCGRVPCGLSSVLQYPCSELEQKMDKMCTNCIFLTRKVLIPSNKFICLNKNETVMVYNLIFMIQHFMSLSFFYFTFLCLLQIVVLGFCDIQTLLFFFQSAIKAKLIELNAYVGEYIRESTTYKILMFYDVT